MLRELRDRIIEVKEDIKEMESFDMGDKKGWEILIDKKKLKLYILEKLEKENNKLETLIKVDDLDELYKTLDYLIDVKSESLDENYLIRKFHENWIVKFEKTIDNKKEMIRLDKQRELIFK